MLSSRDFDKLKGLVSGYDILFIDEAQRIPDIGINLKILHDELPELKIIVTGSSSFDLANRVKEPLTGRTWTYKLYPISASEWQNHASINDFEMQMNLDQWMRYGLYPQVLSFDNYEDKRQYLEEITGAYLYKDILALANIYFWRTHSGAELDYVEEKDGRLFGFEFKWKSKGGKAPKTWMETYDNASYKLVNQDNFMEFVSGN